jgi:hypothetical protein
MRGHHLWRDVSELNKPREFAAWKEKRKLQRRGESKGEGQRLWESCTESRRFVERAGRA